VFYSKINNILFNKYVLYFINLIIKIENYKKLLSVDTQLFSREQNQDYTHLSKSGLKQPQ
jgi:hypothetical protein